MKLFRRVPRAVFLLASTHLTVDAYGNIFAPLLPLLIDKLHLSLAMAGTLTMLYQMAASVAQIGFGHLADHWRPRVLVIVGPPLSVIVLSLIGTAPNVAWLAMILIVGGLGSAAFHPPAAALAHRLGGERPGLAMSVHVTGGSLGMALGPLLFAPGVQLLGLRATPLLALPGLMAVALCLPRMPPFDFQQATARRGFRALRPYARPLSLLYAVVVLRTLTSLAFATYVPVMLTRRGSSLAQAGVVVAAYLFAGGVGGLFGGPAADRFGPRTVIACSMVASAPLLMTAPFLSGWSFFVVLALGGFFLSSTLPVNVIYGNMIAPVSAATVSSLMMGFGWGTGGLAVPLVGALADRFGIPATLTGFGAVPLIAAALALPLPSRVDLSN